MSTDPLPSKEKQGQKSPKQKQKTTQSVAALNDAFNKPPKWKLREQMHEKRVKQATARKQRNRQKMIDNIKSMNGDDDDGGGNAFDLGTLDEMFADKHKNNSAQVQNDDAVKPKHDNWNASKNKPPPKKRERKRIRSKPVSSRHGGEGGPPPKKTKTEPEFHDADFMDQGVVLTTVHAKKTASKTPSTTPSTTTTTNESSATVVEAAADTSTASASAALEDKTQGIKKQTLSQIHRFELTQLLVQNIPRSYDELTLDNHLWSVCRVRTEDIHLFHNVRDTTKNGKAVLTFLSPNDCGIAYKYLMEQPLPSDADADAGAHDANTNADNNALCQLCVKPINLHHQHQQKHPRNKNKPSSHCTVLKLSNLHWKTSERDICEFFKTLIGVRPRTTRIHITAEGCPNGEAKVEFADAQNVQNALGREKTSCVIMGRTITMQESASKQVRASDGAEFQGVTTQVSVFNISGGIDESDLREFIVDTFKSDREYEPRDVHLVQHLQRFTTGYAFVTFATPQTADAVVHRLNNAKFCGRTLRVSWNRPSKPYVLRTELAGQTHIVMLTNLRYDVTEHDIQRFIGRAQPQDMRKIMICENHKGFRYGMAKIWCASPQVATEIVDACNQKPLKDRTVNMNYWNINNGRNKNGQQQQQQKRSPHHKKVRGGGVLDHAEGMQRDNTHTKPEAASARPFVQFKSEVVTEKTVTDRAPSRLLNRLLRD